MSAWIAVPFAVGLLLLVGAYLLWWVDRYRWEPLPRFGLTGALACAAALLVAVTGPRLQAALGTRDLPVIAFTVLAEEVLALAVLQLFAGRGHLDCLQDGAVYGVAAGVGLALPGLGVALVVGDPTIPWRGTFMVLVHCCACVALGSAAAWGHLSGRRGPRLGFAGLGLAGACCLRALGQLAAAAVGGASAGATLGWLEAVLPAVALLALGGLVVGVQALESRILARQLAEEVEYGTLPGATAAVASHYWRRVRSSWWPAREERRVLSGLLVELAVKKEQLRGLSAEARNLYGLEVGRLRHRVRVLLAEPGSEPLT